MAVPPESTGDVAAEHGLVPRHDVLDGAGEDVSVVGEAGGEGGTVVEDVLFVVLGSFKLGFEGVDLIPEIEDLLLLRGEREVFALWNVVHGGERERERDRQRQR